MIRKLFAAIFAFALLAGACSSSDSGNVATDESGESGDDNPTEFSDLARAIADGILDESDENPDDVNFDISDDQALCVGQRLVDDFGDDRVTELGLDTTDPAFSDFTDDELGELIAAFNGCVDDFASIARTAFIEGLQEDEDFPISDADAECLVDDILDVMGADGFLLASLQSSDSDDLPESFLRPFIDALFNCVDVGQIFLDQFDAEGVPREIGECIVDRLGEPELRQFFEASFDPAIDEDAVSEEVLTPAIEACT